VRADPTQIEQVLLNLVANARDAMPSGGRLSFETGLALLGPDEVAALPGLSPGPHVLLIVADNGTGMDAATRARVFEPFFTTKPRGRGTGLGLATVFGIVKQSGGAIALESEPGAGTTFRIYLPRVDAPDDAPEQAQPAAAARGDETVLLVEDDDQVRTVLHQVLARAGYEVLPASGPAEALAACGQRAAPIHLLVTDVVMPRMNGRQLAARVRDLRPATRVLYLTGWSEDAFPDPSADPSADPDAEILQKPVAASALLRAVRRILDRP
jgi:CheY-like chemotaxis protein